VSSDVVALPSESDPRVPTIVRVRRRRRRFGFGNVVNLAIALLVVVLVAAVLATRFAPATGYRVAGVLGDFMAPALPAGTAVAARTVPYPELRVGDAILVQPAGSAPVVRRIEEIRVLGTGAADTYFRIKADGLDRPEPVLVRPHQVLGRVDAALPYAGYLVLAASTDLGFWLIVSIVGSVLTIQLIADEVFGRRHRQILADWNALLSSVRHRR
jgi:hypothetical protein